MAPYAAHSALEPAGASAAQSLALFNQSFGVSALLSARGVGVLGVAVGQKRTTEPEGAPPSPASERKRKQLVAWATAATTLVLLALLVASVSTGHAMASLPAQHPVRVQVVSHKWWWEFRYAVGGPATQFSTAYELHIPVGRPIELELVATDVIHSFWVPSLSGKRDAIPGKHNVLVIRADRPGVFEGQCAEFCGTEHAHMRFLVVAESAQQFAAWRDHQLGSPAPPSDPLRQRGLQVFMNSRCSACHAIGGT